MISGAADGNVLPTLADGPLSGLGGKGAVRDFGTVPNSPELTGLRLTIHDARS